MPGSNKYSYEDDSRNQQPGGNTTVTPPGGNAGVTEPAAQEQQPVSNYDDNKRPSPLKPKEQEEASYMKVWGKQPTVSQEQPEPKWESNYKDLYQIYEHLLDSVPLETEEQRKEREKRERLEGIIAGIGDTASALGNLFFTSKGAPNMYNPANSMSRETQARFDKAKAEREQNLRNHLHYAMTIGKLKDADRSWKRQLEQDAIAAAQREHDNKIADAKEERERELAELERDLRNHRIDGAKADARRKKIEADYAERERKAKIKRDNAAAGASNARARYYDNGGSGRTDKPREFKWYDRNGGVHYARDYKTAEYNARQNGTWVEEFKDMHGNVLDGGYSVKEHTASPLKGGNNGKQNDKTDW